ncbi:triose-phosphate isomerase [Halobellus marinus]|uniref:triose-phosphate isomerase n=1 Tax=Halobellus TaxID=1073986 RepID=UPI0028A8C5C8|nr:triose-phosphate isomerase [Halobellus sp. DFY28]
MNLEYPYFQINFKIYPGTTGEDGLEFARLIERVERETGANFVLTPQIPDIRLIAEETDLTVTAPYMDAVEPGRGMGRILPETIREAGAEGVVINHAENRETLADLARKIERCREVGLDSIVCVDSIAMGEAVAPFDPDSVVFEKPEDISTDRAITQTHPDLVREFIDVMASENERTKVLVGGGIGSADDVRLAFEQGADATGAASAVSLADDPETLLTEIGNVFP